MFKSCLEAEKEFEKCWRNAKYTSIKLDDVDVNQTLSYYETQKPVHFTRKMLWDMEKKKAWNPGNYISYVIREGSAKSWEKHKCPETDGEIFVRCSAQRKWLNPEVFEEVYEEVYVNDKDQIVTFLGVKRLPGNVNDIHPTQPIFHVQHGVAGNENRPLNTWRIIHLTEESNKNLIEHFNGFNDPTILPGFIKAYIEKDLKIPIRKK